MPDEPDGQAGADLLLTAISANAFMALDPWYDSTGFRTAQLAHANTALGRERPAEDFLVGSRLVRGDAQASVSVENYFRDASVTMLSLQGQEARTGIRRIPLPPGPKARMALGEAIARRRSVRMYTGDPVPLGTIATLIRGVVGITGTATVQLMGPGQATLRYRATPSGGGLYPNDLYLAALAVDGLERGIYKAAPVDDALIQIGDASEMAELLRGYSAPEDLISLSRAAAVFLIVGRPWRSMRKYGARGVRLMLLEAGAMAQHLNLLAAALGLGSVDCSAFFDDEIDAALCLDGVAQTILHTVVVGESA